jgi:hypothetical protein
MRLPGMIAALGLLLSAAMWAQTAKPHAATGGRAPVTGLKDTGPPPPPPALPQPTTEAQLREFLLLTDASNRIHEDLKQATNMLRSRFPPYIPGDVWQDLQGKLQGLDIVKAYLPYYQGYISEKDMNALLAFYRTDAGKHYAAVQGTLLTTAQLRLSAEAQAIMENVLVKHKDEIEAAKKKSEGQTSPAPARK